MKEEIEILKLDIQNLERLPKSTFEVHLNLPKQIDDRSKQLPIPDHLILKPKAKKYSYRVTNKLKWSDGKQYE